MSVRSARLILGLLILLTPSVGLAYYDPCQITGVGCPPAASAGQAASAAAAPIPPESPWITVQPIGSDPVTHPTYPAPVRNQGTDAAAQVPIAPPASVATSAATAQLAEPLHAGADLSGTGPGSMMAGASIAAAIAVLCLSFLPPRHAHKP